VRLGRAILQRFRAYGAADGVLFAIEDFRAQYATTTERLCLRAGRER